METPSPSPHHFLNAVSHHLRTPLNGLLLQIHLIEAALKTGNHELLQQALADLKATARLSIDTLNQLTQYAALESIPTTPVSFDLAHLLEKLHQRHLPRAQAKHLDFPAPATPPIKLHTRGVKLEQLLNHLLDNALKFTPKGQITLTADSPSSPLIHIHIRDTGPGLSPATLEHLAAPFFQQDNRQSDPAQGLGLGLATAYRLALHLGGTLHVQSTLGVGSCFTLTLPREEPPVS